MNIVRIHDIHQPEVQVFSGLSEAQLRHNMCSAGIFIAESPKVIRTALSAGCHPVSMLCEERHITGDAADIIAGLHADFPVYTGSRDVLASLTGYTLTRGVLCAMERPALPSMDSLLEGATRVAVIDGVCDTTNIGSIFRAAAALGIDAILLTPTSCDPLNRRSIRVSMGTVFNIPWCFLDAPVRSLKNYGFSTIAMALKPDSIPLDSPVLASLTRAAIILGTEGDGLADNVIADADYSVVIPMHHDVDSLNVASAAAVVFWQLRDKHKLNK